MKQESEIKSWDRLRNMMIDQSERDECNSEVHRLYVRPPAV